MDQATRFLDAALMPLAILFSIMGAFTEYSDWRRGLGLRVRILANVFLVIVFTILFAGGRIGGTTRYILLWVALPFLLGWIVTAVIAVRHRLRQEAHNYDNL